MVCLCVRFVSVVCFMCLGALVVICCVMVSGVFACVFLCEYVCLKFNVFVCFVCGLSCGVVCCVGVYCCVCVRCCLNMCLMYL